ncbi:hypothetical protein [Pseudomonas sp. LP_7_YM]|uniref:hypothetical protein n=1 Tax=Pseudomonas sp. LP_7_YM TaxID=2485137 RepID=UPI00105C172A|nr:hypothetical protein [Pseudomonas sp. LP_7_YM]TDV58528.1 hypothetical protein EC915_1372 [Pseudomonas sp. LP_7_YM]
MSNYSEMARVIVNSNAYAELVVELKSELAIKVIDGYADVFADIDGAAINRSQLTLNELEALFATSTKDLKKYSMNKYKALHGMADEQDYPVGEEPSEADKEKNIISQGYALGFLLANGIELLMAKKGKQFLERYLKESRIPKANSYAKQVISFMP